MTLPVGVIACTLTLSRPKNAIGTEGEITGFRIKADRRIIWAADGESYYESWQDVEPAEDGTISIPVPCVDQDGWIDRSGAAVKFFLFKVEYVARVAGGRVVVNKRVQPVIGQASLDIDMVPDGPAVPAAVAPFSPGDPIGTAAGLVEAEAERATTAEEALTAALAAALAVIADLTARVEDLESHAAIPFVEDPPGSGLYSSVAFDEDPDGSGLYVVTGLTEDTPGLYLIGA